MISIKGEFVFLGYFWCDEKQQYKYAIPPKTYFRGFLSSEISLVRRGSGPVKSRLVGLYCIRSLNLCPIFSKFRTNIPFCNSLDKFVEQKNLMLPNPMGFPPNFGFRGPKE